MFLSSPILSAAAAAAAFAAAAALFYTCRSFSQDSKKTSVDNEKKIHAAVVAANSIDAPSGAVSAAICLFQIEKTAYAI